ncbi:MAG: NADH-quinone oxidoreductase subunit F, partial [Bacteroidota bacterium]
MKKIKVGLGTCGISAGGERVFETLINEIEANKLDVLVSETGCMGRCYDEVLVEVVDEAKESYLYANITPEKAKQIVTAHLIENHPVSEWIVNRDNGIIKDDLFNKQLRIVLRNCGVIDPRSIDEYIEQGGYQAIQKVIRDYSQMEVIDLMIKSGLRGRGGAGFSTGMKWKFAHDAVGDLKYIICNADEGDPGAFMDRSVLEGDPHAVLEGMMIGAYAIGAEEGYIYARAEYPLAIKRLKIALSQCEERGFLGKNIFGSGVNLKIKIKEGAGAFVCGEETV